MYFDTVMDLKPLSTPESGNDAEKLSEGRINENLALFASSIDVTAIIRSYENLRRLRSIDVRTLGQEQRTNLLTNLQRLLQHARTISDVDQRLDWVSELARVLVALDPASRAAVADTCKSFVSSAIEELQKDAAARKGHPLDILDRRMRELARLLGQHSFPAVVNVLEQELASLDAVIQRDAASSPRYVDGLLANTVRQDEMRVFGPGRKALESLKVFEGKGIVVEDGRPFLIASGRRWRLVAFDDGLEEDFLVTAIADGDPDLLVTVPYKELADSLEQKRADDIVSRAEKSRRSEVEQGNRLKAYDLPPQTRIVYLRVFPRRGDPAIRANIQPSALLVSALKARYAGLEAPPPVFTDQAATDLQARVGAAYASGCRYFCLDLYNHGSPDKLNFQDPLTAGRLLALVRQYPGAFFHISTIGCYGGGLRDGFLRELGKDPELGKRVAVFLQTKAHTPNKAGYLRGRVDRGPDPSRTYSTFYYLAFLRALQQGKTYGEAAQSADTETKRHNYADPEAIIDGYLISHGGSRPIAGRHLPG